MENLLHFCQRIPWIFIGRALFARLHSGATSDPPGDVSRVLALDPASPNYRVQVPCPCPQLTLLIPSATGLASLLKLAPTAVPAVFNRFYVALQALPPPTIVAPVPLGPWCADLLLWNNPLLLAQGEVPLQLERWASLLACPVLVSIKRPYSYSRGTRRLVGRTIHS